MVKRKTSIKKVIRQHVRGSNKCLTKEHLCTLSAYALLCNCHPLYRKGYATQLNNIGAITDDELSDFQML